MSSAESDSFISFIPIWIPFISWLITVARNSSSVLTILNLFLTLGGNETVYHRLGLESMCLGLEPSQNPAWDLTPSGWNSNPAKTHSTWFQGLMKLRFLMSHCRKNSVIDKMMSKWIYSDTERSTLRRVWAITEGKCSGCEMCHG